MALTYIVGNPGSGKSYFAVNEIYKYFYTKKTKPDKNDGENLKKYKYCYTNINEFKFELFDNVFKLDLDEFKAHLSILFEMYKAKSPDKELVEYCQNAKIDNALIVIDEVHNLLTDDEITIWWLTYHRHLYQNLIFITQDLVLVPSGLKRIAEFVYKAVDITKRFRRNSLRYVLYSSYKMTLNSIVKGSGVTLKINDEVSNLYHSGDQSKNKPIIGKFIVLIAFILISVLTAFYFFVGSFFKTPAAPVVENNFSAPAFREFGGLLPSSLKTLEYAAAVAYEIDCFLDTCNIKGGEYRDFPRSYFRTILKDKDLILYDNAKMTFSKVESYFLLLKKPIFENLKKVENEKNDFNGTSSGGFIF